MNNNIQAVEGKIASLQGEIAGVKAKLDALDGRITFLMATVALAVGLGPIVAKLIR